MLLGFFGARAESIKTSYPTPPRLKITLGRGGRLKFLGSNPRMLISLNEVGNKLLWSTKILSFDHHIFYVIFIHILCVECFACMSACIHTTCVPGVYQDQQKALCFLELELHGCEPPCES